MTAETPSKADASPPDLALENLELQLLLEAIFQRYGYDFRNYAPASFRRRVQLRLGVEQLATISELQARILHDPAAFERFLVGLTVHVTAMFRDPPFYAVFRERIVPWLRTYPFLRLWVAGCSSGEEVYSLVILLEEEGLYDRCRLYATDLSDKILAKAKAGVFSVAAMQEYTNNYFRAGGTGAFSQYYTADHEHALLRPALRRNIVFAQHNLVSDAGFNEFHVICCRNVMIYFNQTLQERVHKLFFDSLIGGGFLALGSKETLAFTPLEKSYVAEDADQKIYRKVKLDS